MAMMAHHPIIHHSSLIITLQRTISIRRALQEHIAFITFPSVLVSFHCTISIRGGFRNHFARSSPRIDSNPLTCLPPPKMQLLNISTTCGTYPGVPNLGLLHKPKQPLGKRIVIWDPEACTRHNTDTTTMDRNNITPEDVHEHVQTMIDQNNIASEDLHEHDQATIDQSNVVPEDPREQHRIRFRERQVQKKILRELAYKVIPSRLTEDDIRNILSVPGQDPEFIFQFVPRQHNGLNLTPGMAKGVMYEAMEATLRRNLKGIDGLVSPPISYSLCPILYQISEPC